MIFRILTFATTSLVFCSLLATTLSAAPVTTTASTLPKKIDNQAIAESINTFAFEVMKPLSNNKPNLLFSPFSIYSSLSMAASGAEGTTKAVMEKALHWPGDRKSVATAFGELNNKLLVSSSGENCALSLNCANALFAEQDTIFLEPFIKIIEEDYKADLQSVDFTKAANATELINTWVSETTDRKIKKLLEYGDVDAATRLVLVNAIYFSGQWQNPFDKKQTIQKPFIVDQKVQLPVQMMHQTSFFNYLEDTSAQIIILPFKLCEAKDVRPSLIIALPSTSTDLNTWQKAITDQTIQKWIKQSIRSRVDVQLPRFCLRKRYDLQSPLSALGMREAFSTHANFSEIDGVTDLFLSKALHEAYFDLNEMGVEAAAATAAVIGVTAVGPSEKPTFTFNANHPFLFFLVDELTGTLLFMGKFADPSLAGCN